MCYYEIVHFLESSLVQTWFELELTLVYRDPPSEVSHHIVVSHGMMLVGDSSIGFELVFISTSGVASFAGCTLESFSTLGSGVLHVSGRLGI